MAKKWKAPKGVSVVYKAKGFRKRPTGAQKEEASERGSGGQADEKGG